MEKKQQTSPEPSLLYKVCFEMFGDDTQLYDALSFTVAPEPSGLVGKGIDYYVEMAEKHEKGSNRNPIVAGANYWNAGRVAMYEGNLKLAVRYFSKYAELNPKSPFVKNFEFYRKKENAEKAMKVAQEYYRRSGQKPQ